MRRFSVAPAGRLLPAPASGLDPFPIDQDQRGRDHAGAEAAEPPDRVPAPASWPGALAARLGVVDRDLLVAFAAAAAPNALRALTSDFVAFEVWCRARGSIALPATPALIAEYLRGRDAGGAAPASLSRYKASLARIHVLARFPDPTRDPIVTLTLRAIRRNRGTAQKQARPLRFKGAVKDVYNDAPRGLSLAAVLAGCGSSLIGLRDAALLSVAYDTGLRAAELVALTVGDLLAAIDPDAGLILVRRTKIDQDGEGATAYLSPRSMRALRAWRAAAALDDGPLFRRVFVRRVPAKAAIAGVRWARVDDGVLRTGSAPDTATVPAHRRYTAGRTPLTPAAVTGVYRRAIVRAFAAGALPDLTADEFALWVRGVSAHSTRVGLTQDLFSAGEDLAGIMDALRWTTPRMPLLYNRNLAAESGAAGRVTGRL